MLYAIHIFPLDANLAHFMLFHPKKEKKRSRLKKKKKMSNSNSEDMLSLFLLVSLFLSAGNDIKYSFSWLDCLARLERGKLFLSLSLSLICAVHMHAHFHMRH